MKGYTSRQEVENYLLITIDASFYDQIESWQEQIEKHIDKLTGRNFVADDEATEKSYDGDGTKTLLIDDCVSIDEIKINDKEIDEADYYLYPANETPKKKIVLAGTVFAKGNQNVTIKAKWGYSVEAPDDIKFAATVMVAGIINYSLNAEGETQSESIGSYSVSYKNEKQWQDFDRIQAILKYYKRYIF